MAEYVFVNFLIHFCWNEYSRHLKICKIVILKMKDQNVDVREAYRNLFNGHSFIENCVNRFFQSWVIETVGLYFSYHLIKFDIFGNKSLYFCSIYQLYFLLQPFWILKQTYDCTNDGTNDRAHFYHQIVAFEI